MDGSDDSWVSVVPEAEPPLEEAEPPSPAPAPAIAELSSAEPDVDSAVRLQGLLEHDTLSLDSDCLGCLAHLTGHAVRGEDQLESSAPIDIVAAVDCSSSIRSAMPLIRRTMAFVVSELRSCDQLSIVCYHTDVSVRLRLQHMDDAGKAAAMSSIESIAARGSTNLSGGILSAISQVSLSPGAETIPSRSAAVLVLTDGFPTCGITAKEPLLEAVHAAHAAVGRPSCPIYAFGFGESHDSIMLSSLVERTEGTYCFIERAEEIAPAFAECLGSLQTLVASNVKLLIEPLEDATVESVLSSYPEESAEPHVISIGDVRVGEAKDVVIELSLPGLLLSPGSPQAYLSLKLSYWDSRVGRSLVIAHTVSVNRESGIDSSPRLEVEEQRQRVLVSRAMQEAQQGSILTGRAALTAAQARLDASPAAVAGSSQLIQQLQRDLQQCLDGFSDQRSYSGSGQHTLSMLSGSHSRQRSVSGSLQRTSSYRTHSQSEAIRRASSMDVTGSLGGQRRGGGGLGADARSLSQLATPTRGGSGPTAESVVSRARLRIGRAESMHALPLQDDSSLIGGKYKLLLREQLGGGGTSAVFRGLDTTTNTPVAIKQMARRSIDCHRDLVEQLKRELNISLRLEHPNIVRLLDVAFDTEHVHLVQEIAEGGDLFDLVSTAGGLPEDRARGIFRQVASAVSYCHATSVFHRDIKMENIVVVRRGSDEVKLTDFGLAKDCLESLEGPKTMRVGTMSFMPPEITEYSRTGYDGAPVDVWGLGCTLFVMTTAEFPFGQDGRGQAGQIMRRIRAGSAGINFEMDQQGRKRTLSPPLVALLQSMLRSNPDERISMGEVMASQWVQGDDGYTDDALSAATNHQPRTVEWPEDQPIARAGASGVVGLGGLGGLDGFDIALDLSDESLLAAPMFDTGVVLQLGRRTNRSSVDLLDLNDDDDDDGLGALQLDDGLQLAGGGGGGGGGAAGDQMLSPVVEVPSSHERTVLSVDVDATPRAPPTVAVSASSSVSRFTVSPIDSATTAQRLRLAQEASDKRLAEELTAAEQRRVQQEQLEQDREEGEGPERKRQKDAFVIPDGLECPITSELMHDPVMCTDGHTYERTAILSWFEEQRKGGGTQPTLTSPLTNVALDSAAIFPNYALKKQCELFAASPAYAEHLANAAGGQQQNPRRRG